MAKASGLGDALFVDGYDLSGDVGAVQTLASPSGDLDVTGLDKSAHERLYGLFDGLIEFRPWFNDAAFHEHLVLRAKASGTDRIVTYFHGAAIGNMAASLVAKQANFDWSRGNDGSLQGTVQAMGNGYGLEYGGGGGTLVAQDGQLTAGKRTDTGATDGASLDCGIAGGTSLGCAAVLHVFAFTGTDATVKIQSSSDDGATDPFADVTGLSFTQITSPPAMERKVTSLTASIERYLRVVTVTTGGFNPMTFAVSHTRYPVDD